MQSILQCVLTIVYMIIVFHFKIVFDPVNRENELGSH